MMLYFNFIMLVVCSHHCVKVTCVYGRQYLAVFCPCAAILLLANMWCGGWELDFVCVCICVCVCTLARTGERGTVTTEMDVLASSEGSQLVWVRKLVLASARSGGVCICAALALSWRGLGRFGASSPPTRQVLKGTHPLPPHNPTGLYTGAKIHRDVHCCST